MRTSFDEYVKVASRTIEKTCPKCKSHNTIFDNTFTMTDSCLDCGHRASDDCETTFPSKWIGLI